VVTDVKIKVLMKTNQHMGINFLVGMFFTKKSSVKELI